MSRRRMTPHASRMTIVTHGDEATVEQIVKQLNKLPDVLKVQDFSEGEFVDRELVLVKVGVDSKSRAEVMQITTFSARKSWTCSPSRSPSKSPADSKMEKFLDLMNSFGVTGNHPHRQGRHAAQIILTHHRNKFMAKVYTDKDADLGVLKNKTLAVLGFGSQGHAHALNLKDSGLKVIIGLYEGSKSIAVAKEKGFKVVTTAEAVKQADVIMVALPDTKQAAVLQEGHRAEPDQGQDARVLARLSRSISRPSFRRRT
jgi:acetolactate synthase small subunit